MLALAAGCVAAFGIKSIFFVDRVSVAIDEDLTPGIKEQLLVANGDLAAGTELNALNVRLTLTPEVKVPRDGIFSFVGVAGCKIARDIKDGEPISLYDIEESSEEEDTVGFVPPGCSIVPIEISSATKENGNRNYLKTTKLNKMIKSGDVVDIMVVREVPSKSGPVALPKLAAETIIENAPVFAVSDENRFGVDGPIRLSTISTLFTADQLEKIRKASDIGKIRIVLRDDTINDQGVAPANVFEPASSVTSTSYYPSITDSDNERFSAAADVAPELTSDDANQPFVIQLNQDPLSTDDAAETVDSVFNPIKQQNFGPANVADGAPSDGHINEDFTIKIDGAIYDETIDANPGNEMVPDSDKLLYSDFPAKWSNVDFDASNDAALDEAPSVQDTMWLGPETFRSREIAADEVQVQASPYKRAVSEDLTAEPSVPTENATDKGATKPVKKYSPFITISSKQTKN